MTIVCGLKHKDKVWIGADSIATCGGFRFPESVKKIYRVGPWLVGAAGSSRVHEILQNTIQLLDAQDIQEFRDVLFTAVGQVFKPYEQKEGGSPLGYDCEFIVSYEDQLWCILSSGTIWQPNAGFCAIGSGQDYAYGAWEMYRRCVRPLHLGPIALTDVIECALALRHDCGGEIQIDFTVKELP